MIPEELHLRNFLSHRETDLDLRGVHVASLIGDNGAGKSALLDAITWAVWGRARTPYGHDEALVQQGETLMEVEFVFRMAYQGGEEHRFRILRRRDQQGRRSASSILDFQVQTTNGWRLLNGNALRETQTRIVERLGLDYDTFINSAYLRQGHADEFTVQTPSDRKRVLSVILGLDQWERYAERARQALATVQAEEKELARRIAEIEQELMQRPAYQKALAQAEAEAQEAAGRVKEAQEALDALTRVQEQAAALQRQLAEARRHADEEQQRLADLQRQQHAHAERRRAYQELLERAPAIESRLKEYQAALAEERAWSEKLGQAARLQEEKARAEKTLTREADALRQRIHALELESARKEQALATARARIEQEIRERQGQIRPLQERLPTPEFLARLEEIEGQLEFTAQVAEELEKARADLQEAQMKRSGLIERNRQLKALMGETKERLDALTQAEASCPLCRQPLTSEHQAQLLAQLQAEGNAMAEEYRNNAQGVRDLQAREAALEQQIREHDKTLHLRTQLEQRLDYMRQQLEQAEEARRRIAAFEAEIAALRKQLELEAYGEAEREARARLQAERDAIAARLAAGEYAPEARAALQEVLAELSRLGYDAAAHNALKARVQTLASAEADYRELEKARVGVQGEEEALKRLTLEGAAQEQRLAQLGQERQALQTAYEALRPQLETVPRVQQSVQEARQREASARQRVGAMQQQLHALDTQERRLAQLREQHLAVGQRSARLKELREAFGVNGIPAMIIEHTLPLFELEANRLLEQLSDGKMHVRFETQRETKGGNLRETLDILISDEKGSRPYENYSGGEQFRVNFAIRVALARLLAQRAGVRPRTLFVDEGFGSLDDDGRQRLVEAIKAVQEDFDLILVITHIEELRDAFPVRIQVSKTEAGSLVEVL